MKKKIPDGYERITYCRCGDYETVEIMRPASKTKPSFSPNISVNVKGDGNICVEDMVKRLNALLIDQTGGDIR